jgi:hypothetical protein
VYLTPRSVALRGGIQDKLYADIASSLFIHDAATPDDAVTRALSTPLRTATVDEVRALVKRPMPIAMAPGAPIVRYGADDSGSNGLVQLTGADLQGFRLEPRCGKYYCVWWCDPERPFCKYCSGTAPTYDGGTTIPFTERTIWLTWRNGRLVVAGVGFETSGGSPVF